MHLQTLQGSIKIQLTVTLVQGDVTLMDFCTPSYKDRFEQKQIHSTF